MIRTKTITLTLTLVLLAVGAVAAQAAVPGATAQQAQPDGDTGFAVDSLTAPDSAAPGSNVTVAATVTNDGEETATEAVEFRVEGDVVDSEYVTLESGETATVQLTADTEGLAPGDYRHGVFTETDGELATITLSDSFAVESLDAPSSATAGDEITVTADVANPNEFNTSQDVAFRLGGALVATENVTIAGNESTEVQFNVSTDGVEAGVYVHSVLTRDSGEFADINITAPPEPPAEETEEPETEEPTDEPETEEPTEAATEEPETEEPTEEETEEPETDEPGTEEPTEEETEEPGTEEPTEEETEEPGTEEPTESQTEESGTDEQTDESSTDESTTDTDARIALP